MDKKKAIQTIYRFVVFVLISKVITVLLVVGIHYSITILTNTGNLGLGQRIGLIEFTLGCIYLQLANVVYWIFGINLLDYRNIKNRVVKTNHIKGRQGK